MNNGISQRKGQFLFNNIRNLGKDDILSDEEVGNYLFNMSNIEFDTIMSNLDLVKPDECYECHRTDDLTKVYAEEDNTPSLLCPEHYKELIEGK